MVRVRTFVPGDERFLLDLAPRLTIGIPVWRDEQRMLGVVQRWIRESIARRGEKAEVFLAVSDEGDALGFATVSEESHFTGETQAYVGELATVPGGEGRGVGAALVRACETWAKDHGYRILTLHTGANNERALGFYHHLGFEDEDIKLVKLVDAHPSS